MGAQTWNGDVPAVARRLRLASGRALSDQPKLERWTLDRSLGRPCMVGFYADPDVADGRFVRTSILRRFAPEAGWALTRNRFYGLGVSMDACRSKR